MKIGIFTDTYLPQINGVVTSIQLLDEGLRRAGHESYIFTLSHPEADSASDPANVFRVHSVRFYGQRDHRIGMIYSKSALQKAAELQLDVVHSHAPFSLGVFGHITARRLKLPEVHTYHTMLEDYTHYVSKRKRIDYAARSLARRYSRIFCNWMTSVVVPTEKVKDALLEYGVVRPIHVLPTGVDLKRFSPPSSIDEKLRLRRLHHLPEQKLLTLFVGRLAQEKSIDVLLSHHAQAVTVYPNLMLVIVGDGDERAALEQESRRLGVTDSVVFAGMRSGSELSEFYRAADIFVTASTSETQGLVVLEAMASGLPVLAIDDPAYRSLVMSGKTGERFSDVKQYRGHLETLQNLDFLSQLPESLRTMTHQYAADGFSQKMLAIYQEALTLGPAAVPSRTNRILQKIRRRSS